MEATVGAGEEDAPVPLARIWAALEQGWTVVQDVASVDLELRSKVGTELSEEVEEGVSYICSVRHAGDSEETVKDVVHVQLKAEKVQELRAGASSDWVRGVPKYIHHRDLSAVSVRQFTLKMQPWFKKELCAEGGPLYAVKVEVEDIMWDGNMAQNESHERGSFVDMVEIRLTPEWEGKDRNPTSFSPPPPNGSTQFQSSTQTTVGGNVGQRTTAGAAFSKSRSQASSFPSWITEWERSADDGSATLRWKLNMLCPSSSSRILYNIESPQTGDWGLRGHVPKLPPAYEKGSFTGLDTTPSAGWTVQASTFYDKKVRWKLDIAVRASTLKAKDMIITPSRFRKWDYTTVEIKPDGLLCLTSPSNPVSSWIIIFLVPALVAAAVAVWLLIHGR